MVIWFFTRFYSSYEALMLPDILSLRLNPKSWAERQDITTCYKKL